MKDSNKQRSMWSKPRNKKQEKAEETRRSAAQKVFKKWAEGENGRLYCRECGNEYLTPHKMSCSRG